MRMSQQQPAPPPSDPELIRGRCPRCKADLVSRIVYVDGRGYLVTWKCRGPGCDYRRVL